MILNKYLSIFLSGCLFLLLMMLMSSVVAIFTGGGSIPFSGVLLIVIFYFVARAFYNYLRNDDFYRNDRKVSSDKKGEKYLVKGEKDSKKLFIIIWVLVILILATVSLWLYSFNNGLVKF